MNFKRTFAKNLILGFLFLLIFGYANAQLVNSNSNIEALRLKALLDSIYGKKIISGQMNDSYLSYIKNTTGGKEPAMMGYDFDGICQSQTSKNNIDADKAIKWVKERGGIAQFNWHWISPDANGDYYTKNFDLGKAMADTTNGSYKNIIRDIDLAAAEIKKMQDAGIAIIWRPLHEAEGKWFWWGMSGGEACIALYRLMYDRFTNLHQLNNLIWAWTSYGKTKENWYPGDDVVDMIVWDYPDYNPNSGSWNQYQQLFGDKDKLFGIGEDGTLLNPDLLETQPWLYFLTWAYMVNDPSQKDGKNSKDWLMQVYNDPRVITLEDLNPGHKACAGYSEIVYDDDNDERALVTLDASLSFADFGDSIIAYSWTLNNEEIATGKTTQVHLPVGVHKIQLWITTGSGDTKSSWVIKTVKRLSLSLNKHIEVSSTEAGYGNVAANAIDGDASTRWSSKYTDPQWMRVDLGKPHDITNVIINWQNASAKDYEIQQSNDGENWITIASFKNMKNGARVDSIKNLEGGARYIRMYGSKRTTQWGYSIFEFEVFGVENELAEPIEEEKTSSILFDESMFKVYPSVVKHNGNLTIHLANSVVNPVVSIFSSNGALIKQLKPIQHKIDLHIDEKFTKGIYFLQVSAVDRVLSKRFVVV